MFTLNLLFLTVSLSSWPKFFSCMLMCLFVFKCHLLCMCACVCYDADVEVDKQPSGANSFLPFCGIQGSNAGHEGFVQAPLYLLSHLSGSANSNRYKSEHLHRLWNMYVMCACSVPHLVTVHIHTKYLWRRHSDYLHLKEEKQGKFRLICLRSTCGMVNPECQLDTPGEREPQTEKLPPSDWHVGISFQHFLYY